jgi:hypothetical protein
MRRHRTGESRFEAAFTGTITGHWSFLKRGVIFPRQFVEPGVRIGRIRLSDKISRLRPRRVVPSRPSVRAALRSTVFSRRHVGCIADPTELPQFGEDGLLPQTSTIPNWTQAAAVAVAALDYASVPAPLLLRDG